MAQKKEFNRSRKQKRAQQKFHKEVNMLSGKKKGQQKKYKNADAFRFSFRQGASLRLYHGKAFEISYHVEKQTARKRGRFSPGIDR